MKKFIVVVLTILAIFTIAGCNSKQTTSKTSTKSTVTSSTKSSSSSTTEDNKVEAFDLKGAEVKIYTKRAQDYDYAYANPLDPTKIRNNDEDTAYWSVVEKVTKYIENKYNCKIKWVDDATVRTETNAWSHLQNQYASGNMYDIVEITGEEFPYMYSNGMVQELKEDVLSKEAKELFWGGEDGFQYSAYVHLDKKWGVGCSNTIWDIQNSTTISTPLPVLFYNVDMLKEAGIEKMPNEYWKEGTWSWDVFEEMCTTLLNNVSTLKGAVTDHFYSGGIMNLLGANGTYIFDDYGNMGFYSEASQEVYKRFNSWYDKKIEKNLEYNGGSTVVSWWSQKDFSNLEVAFSTNILARCQTYWQDVNYSVVPYPFGPNAALASDPTKINEDKYKVNVYTTGYFWTVPKGKDVRLYQLLAEFYGGMKEYYTNADDIDATIEDIHLQLFAFDDENSLEVMKYVQENMTFSIIMSAVPSGIFRQAIREHYTKTSPYYGNMWGYMQSRQKELAPENPNNFWKSIFGDPGIVAQS